MAAPCAVWLGDPVERVPCPYDVHHRVPRASLERHAASCRLRKMGYSAEEQIKIYSFTLLSKLELKVEKKLQATVKQMEP